MKWLPWLLGAGCGLLVAYWFHGLASRAVAALEAIGRRPQLPPFEPDWDSCPSKPILCEPGFSDETWERFEYRIAHYETQRDAWVLSEARKMITSR